MTRRRLEWLLRARGTDLSSWPEAEQRAALALMGRSKPARQAFADALAREDAPETDSAVLVRMQQALRRGLAPASAMVRGMRWSALAVCVAAGLYLGTAADPDTQPDLFTSAQTVSLAAPDP